MMGSHSDILRWSIDVFRFFSGCSQVLTDDLWIPKPWIQWEFEFAVLTLIIRKFTVILPSWMVLLSILITIDNDWPTFWSAGNRSTRKRTHPTQMSKTSTLKTSSLTRLTLKILKSRVFSYKTWIMSKINCIFHFDRINYRISCMRLCQVRKSKNYLIWNRGESHPDIVQNYIGGRGVLGPQLCITW